MRIQELKEEISKSTIKDIHNIILDAQEIISILNKTKNITNSQFAGMIAEERSSLENYFLKFDIYKNPTESELEEFNEILSKLIGIIDNIIYVQDQVE
jgi:hypothetical protein